MKHNAGRHKNVKRKKKHVPSHREFSTKEITEDTEDSACLGAHLFALRYKSHLPTKTTQKMVSSPSHSSNLFNVYLVEPQ